MVNLQVANGTRIVSAFNQATNFFYLE